MTTPPESPSYRADRGGVGDARRRRSLILLVVIAVLFAVAVWMTRDYWLAGDESGGDPVGNMTLPPPPGATLPTTVPADEDADEPAAPSPTPGTSGSGEGAKAPGPTGAGQAR